MADTPIDSANQLLNAFVHRKKTHDNTTAITAQRLVNLFRQLSVFKPEFVAEYNRMLLSASDEVRMMMKDIVGGPTVRQYLDFLQAKSEQVSEDEENEHAEMKSELSINTGYLPDPEEDTPFAFRPMQSHADQTVPEIVPDFSQSEAFMQVLNGYQEANRKQTEILTDVLKELKNQLKKGANVSQPTSTDSQEHVAVQKLIQFQETQQTAFEQFIRAQTEMISALTDKLSQIAVEENAGRKKSVTDDMMQSEKLNKADETETPVEMPAPDEADETETPVEMPAPDEADEAETPVEMSEPDESDETETPVEMSAPDEADETETPAEMSAPDEADETETPVEVSEPDEADETETPAEMSAPDEADETETPAEMSAPDESDETETPAEMSEPDEADETAVPVEVFEPDESDETETPVEMSAPDDENETESLSEPVELNAQTEEQHSQDGTGEELKPVDSYELPPIPKLPFSLYPDQEKTTSSKSEEHDSSGAVSQSDYSENRLGKTESTQKLETSNSVAQHEHPTHSGFVIPPIPEIPNGGKFFASFLHKGTAQTAPKPFGMPKAPGPAWRKATQPTQQTEERKQRENMSTPEKDPSENASDDIEILNDIEI